MDAEELWRGVAAGKFDRRVINCVSWGPDMWPSRDEYQARARLSALFGDITTHPWEWKMSLDHMDKLIEWSLFKWRDRKEQNERGEAMNDEIVIELRVNFADKEKTKQVIAVACSMARTLKANVQFLGPVHAPEVIVRHGDYFHAPEEIDLFSDLIAAGTKELDKVYQAAADKALTPATQGATQDATSGEVIDQELLDAVREMKR